jgi:hypothetical protein
MRKYLDILSSTFMVRQLPPWHKNLSKRRVKSPRIYARDSGLLHCLLRVAGFTDLEAHPKLGASWEGFALEQVLSLTGERDARKRPAAGRNLLPNRTGTEQFSIRAHVFVVGRGAHAVTGFLKNSHYSQ